MPPPITLNYAAPSAAPRRPLLPALLVALVGCPLATSGAAILGFWLGTGSGRMSSPDLRGVAFLGAFAGVFGGVLTAGVAVAGRRYAMPVAIICVILVAGITGASMLLLMGLAGAG